MNKKKCKIRIGKKAYFPCRPLTPVYGLIILCLHAHMRFGHVLTRGRLLLYLIILSRVTPLHYFTVYVRRRANWPFEPKSVVLIIMGETMSPGEHWTRKKFKEALINKTWAVVYCNNFENFLLKFTSYSLKRRDYPCGRRSEYFRGFLGLS